MQFSARFASTIHYFLIGTSWLIKGRTIHPSSFAGWVHSLCRLRCWSCPWKQTLHVQFHAWQMKEQDIRFLVFLNISLVQDVPKGTTLLSHLYGDSFLHLPSVEASAGTPCSFTSCQKAREMLSLMPTVSRCCVVLARCYLALVCWTTHMKVAFTCQRISI